MVTFAFLILLTIFSSVLAIIDSYLYTSSFIESFQTVIFRTEGTRRWIVELGMLFGLISSLIIDYRYKQNN